MSRFQLVLSQSKYSHEVTHQKMRVLSGKKSERSWPYSKVRFWIWCFLSFIFRWYPYRNCYVTSHHNIDQKGKRSTQKLLKSYDPAIFLRPHRGSNAALASLLTEFSLHILRQTECNRWKLPNNHHLQANLCWRHCLHFSSSAYDLNHRSRGRIYELNAKVERADD